MQYNPLYWLCKTLAFLTGKLLFKVTVEHPERLLKHGSGGTIIASNHESFLDPPIISSIYPGQIHFLARNTLFKGALGLLIKNLKAVPISQDGADLASIKTIIKEVKSGSRVLIFPEGARTYDGELQGAAAGIGMIVTKSKAIVQPIRIKGAFEAWPRNRKAIKRVPITVTVGEPIPFTEEDLKARSKDQYQAIADRIMNEIASL